MLQVISYRFWSASFVTTRIISIFTLNEKHLFKQRSDLKMRSKNFSPVIFGFGIPLLSTEFIFQFEQILWILRIVHGNSIIFWDTK